MKLTELEPQLMAIVEPGRRYRKVETLSDAQGVQFLCPGCFVKNGGAIGTHMALAWFRDRGVPDDEPPLPGRWVVEGQTVDDLTLTPSILLTSDGGCVGWHGFVSNGEIVNA